jgi:hypothetical protein
LAAAVEPARKVGLDATTGWEGARWLLPRATECVHAVITRVLLRVLKVCTTSARILHRLFSVLHRESASESDAEVDAKPDRGVSVAGSACSAGESVKRETKRASDSSSVRSSGARRGAGDALHCRLVCRVGYCLHFSCRTGTCGLHSAGAVRRPTVRVKGSTHPNPFRQQPSVPRPSCGQRAA